MVEHDDRRGERDRWAALDGGGGEEDQREREGAPPGQTARKEDVVQVNVEHEMGVGGGTEPVREAEQSDQPAPQFLPTLLFVLAVLILAGALVLLLGSGVLG